MKDSLHRALDAVRADEALIENTARRVRGALAKRAERSWPRKLALACALLALCVVAGLSAYRFYHFYYTPAAFVSIDVNPSVELTLNRRDKVIDTYAYNAAGERALLAADLRGKSYAEATRLLLAEIEEEGYFSQEALISVTVQSGDRAKEQNLCDAIGQMLHAQFGAAQSQPDIEVYPVDAEIWDSAHHCGVSPARYLAIQELLAVDEEATFEAYSDSSLHQIRQRTRECGGHSSNNQQGQGHGHGHGH